MNVYRFDGRHSRSFAAFSIILGCVFWFFGNFNCSALAVVSITGTQVVANLSVILGSPEQFAADMKESTQDFIKDHFGSRAIAAAFGIAIRMRS
jgi:hypothetical protein